MTLPLSTPGPAVKTMDVGIEAPESTRAGPSTAPHRMRITSAGSMHSYIHFALTFLEEHPTTPLVLHTLPPAASDPSISQPLVQPAAARPAATLPSTLQPCTATAPKLISIVEIIKRDYLLALEKGGRGKGKHRAQGLWQYTQAGLVSPADLRLDPHRQPQSGEGGGGDDDVAGRDLTRVLNGKTKPKMTHYPYLQVTLSRRPLGLEKSQKDTSCQYVIAARYRKPGASKAASNAAAGAAGGVGAEGEGGGKGESTAGDVSGDAVSKSVAAGPDTGLDLGEKIDRRAYEGAQAKKRKDAPASLSGTATVSQSQSGSLAGKERVSKGGVTEGKKVKKAKVR